MSGDFGMSPGREPKLTDADREARKKAEAKIAEVQKEYSPLVEKYVKRRDELRKKDPDADESKDAELKKLVEAMRPYQERMAEHYDVLRKTSAQNNYHGHVWLFQRRPPATTTTRPE